MEFFENRIVAKSTQEFFQIEKSGMKPNTIRVLDRSENYKMLEFIRRIGVKYIQIRNTKTGEVFEKRITDISKIDLGLHILTDVIDEESKEDKLKKSFIKADIYIISFEK